jgi:hypothetical protein
MVTPEGSVKNNLNSLCKGVIFDGAKLAGIGISLN